MTFKEVVVWNISLTENSFRQNIQTSDYSNK
jgi:hypothetical protein